MFKHILVPVDGSSTSMLAVARAAEMAKHFGSAVTALYVVDPYPFTGIGADFAYGQAQYLSAATAEANTALEAVKKAMQDAGVNVNAVVGEGHAVHEGIERALESTGADLVVMGSHGRRGLEKFMLGSVTQRVLGVVKVPVLVVHHAQDACALCRPHEVPLILQGLGHAPAKKLLMLHGGGEATGDPCEAAHFHGFIGMEQAVVDAISAWIRNPADERP